MRSAARAFTSLWVSIRAAASAVVPVAAASGLLFVAAPAGADVKAVEPYCVTVKQEFVPMRCSDTGYHYAVRTLKSGAVLRVDGEGPGWVRVEYLPGMQAFVKTDEASVEADGKTMKLTKPSRLLAANEAKNERGNWWYLLDSELSPGTALQITETIKGVDGKVSGYLVAAPPQARGFVKADAVRKATDEEAASYKGIPGAATAAKPVPVLTNPNAPRPGPGTTPDTTSGAAPGTQPPVPGITPPTQTQPPAPGITPPAPTPASPEGTQPLTTTPPPIAAPPPAPKPVGDTEVLKGMFDKVMAEKADTAEIQTVIGEFNRKINSLGKSPEDQRAKVSLEQRLRALRLRTEVLETMKSVKEQADKPVDESRLRELVAEAERQSVYTIVGRIVPSTVYDGKRGMPLMYRIESADMASTRTVGYVVPREGVELLTKLGRVVGVVGESRYDEALRMNLVSPRRVDLLNAPVAAKPIAEPSKDVTNPEETKPDINK